MDAASGRGDISLRLKRGPTLPAVLPDEKACHEADRKPAGAPSRHSRNRVHPERPGRGGPYCGVGKTREEFLAREVERSAAGIEDNPLTDIIEAVREAYGDEAAAAVLHFFDRLVAELGPDLLADVDPIILPPELDVDNGLPDEKTVPLTTGAYILDIGTTENVGDREFCRIVLGLVDSDDDNDAEQLLNEIVTGTSGANLDFE